MTVLCQCVVGREHPVTLASIDNLACAYESQGQTAKAANSILGFVILGSLCSVEMCRNVKILANDITAG